MLNSLHIENIAVIKSVDIDFTQGFTALTGETGAGKSIIIDSIGLLLGKKAERDLIRTSESSAMVSGLFSGLSDISLATLHEAGITPDEEGNILVQRSISKDGKSQVKINGRSVSIAILKDISEALINIHGQNDTRALTASENHLTILDSFAENEKLLDKYSEAYSHYEKLNKEIKDILERERDRERYTEILEYQINDIDSLDLKDGEEEELVDKKVKLKNSEKIMKQAGFAYKALKGSEKGSVSFLLDRASVALSSISDVIPSFSEYSDTLREFQYRINDIAEEVYASFDDMDENPDEKLNDIESRLDKISKIKRKYGLTVADVLRFRDEAYAELERLKNSDDLLERLYKEEKMAYDNACVVAKKLHEARVKWAVELEKDVLNTLEFLDMPKVIFLISIKESNAGERKKLTQCGFDNVEFLISANKDMEPKPLSKIASGGELARIMLALKSVIANKDGVLTIVFDEIDAGVSGKTARKIGIKMQELAKTTQLFCITHSAQIASLADKHLLIKKSEGARGVETSVDVLDYNGRICELSRILGGINVTEAQRAAAIDMLKERETYKNSL